MIKNIEKANILHLVDEVSVTKGQVVSKTLSQSKHINLSLFAFDAKEGLSTHTATGDALVQVLQGRVKIVIADEVFELSEGETICLPANIPHSLYALTAFKMLLTVVFPE